jgi:hypothetical protein
VAAVLAVAAVAALISYRHAVMVVTAHGEPGTIGKCYPVVIDGLIVAASMVLLDAARHQEKAPALSVWLLAAGIGATLAVNVLAGVSSGLLGAVVAAWPALGFVGCYELLMLLVRASVRRSAPTSAFASVPASASVSAAAPETRPHPAPASASVMPPSASVPASVPRVVTPRRKAVADADAEVHFAADLASGLVPSARRIQRELRVGQPRASEIRQHLESVLTASP